MYLLAMCECSGRGDTNHIQRCVRNVFCHHDLSIVGTFFLFGISPSLRLNSDLVTNYSRDHKNSRMQVGSGVN
jgi:hypothetical protein